MNVHISKWKAVKQEGQLGGELLRQGWGRRWEGRATCPGWHPPDFWWSWVSWGPGHVCSGVFRGRVLLARGDTGRETNSCAVSRASWPSAGSIPEQGPLTARLQRFSHEVTLSTSSPEGRGCSSCGSASGAWCPGHPRIPLQPGWASAGVEVSLALTSLSPPGTREPHRSQHPAQATPVPTLADPSEAVWRPCPQLDFLHDDHA